MSLTAKQLQRESDAEWIARGGHKLAPGTLNNLDTMLAAGVSKGGGIAEAYSLPGRAVSNPAHAIRHIVEHVHEESPERALWLMLIQESFYDAIGETQFAKHRCTCPRCVERHVFAKSKCWCLRAHYTRDAIAGTYVNKGVEMARIVVKKAQWFPRKPDNRGHSQHLFPAVNTWEKPDRTLVSWTRNNACPLWRTNQECAALWLGSWEFADLCEILGLDAGYFRAQLRARVAA